jgi:predicted HicB family RNase H-like nuclease
MTPSEVIMGKRLPFQLRVPADVKAWMTVQAELNGSSQNSEVIRALRAAMARLGKDAEG